MKPQPTHRHPVRPYHRPSGGWTWVDASSGIGDCDAGWWCPYGGHGDRLWVRETWAPRSGGLALSKIQRPFYRATDGDGDQRSPWPWRPSIHMPRWACRIVLELTDVRVQRLQDISEDDARAEGIEHRATCYYPPTRDGGGERAPDPQSTARSAFALLWDDVNGGGAWDANPWVWALTFKRVTP